MLFSQAVLKVIPQRNKLITMFACILLIGLGTHYLWRGTPSEDTVALTHTATPLLLNSEGVLAKEAEASVVLWFEDGDIPLEVWKNRPMLDWIWNYKELQTERGKVAVTLSGHRKIDKNEEIILYTWYTTNAQEIAKMGGRIYLDERITQAIDISAYLSQTNAHPAQWAIEGNLVSIAANQSNLKTSVIAGQDQINIQLLSRGKNTEGQTALAIPVLLGEF